MQSMPIDRAEGHLAELVAMLSHGEELVLTEGEKPVATIRAALVPPRKPPRFGTLCGSIRYLAPDFDAVPEGFEDYLP